MAFQPGVKYLQILYGSAMVVFFLPLIIFSWARFTNSGDQEEDNNEQNQNNYDNNNNNNNNNNQQACKWWQWSCSDNYNNYDENGNRDEEENALPWWWMWSEDERRRDPEDQTNPTLIVIYIWTVLMLLFILFYAYKTVKEYRDMVGLSVSFLMLANFSFVSMLYLGSLEGAIEDDGRVIEEQGFYGQFGVLLYLTNVFATIFGVAWFILTRSMAIEQHTTKVDVSPSDYLKAEYEAPSVTVKAKEKEIA
mmetsp:Transcript_3939/g.7849  ORF Transcript_3939/g.7849 Transcript_3939/m.7849 type:complete len:250 (+) Transcript_3939:33-782(+)